VTDEEVAREIQLVLPADNRNQKRIQDCVTPVLDKTVRRLGLGESFTVQLGDSTDIIYVAILLVCGPWVYDGEFEDLILCKSTESLTGEDIF
jgi:hypothetical protein